MISPLLIPPNTEVKVEPRFNRTSTELSPSLSPTPTPPKPRCPPHTRPLLRRRRHSPPAQARPLKTLPSTARLRHRHSPAKDRRTSKPITTFQIPRTNSSPLIKSINTSRTSTMTTRQQPAWAPTLLVPQMRHLRRPLPQLIMGWKFCKPRP